MAGWKEGHSLTWWVGFSGRGPDWYFHSARCAIGVWGGIHVCKSTVADAQGPLDTY